MRLLAALSYTKKRRGGSFYPLQNGAFEVYGIDFYHEFFTNNEKYFHSKFLFPHSFEVMAPKLFSCRSF